MRWLLCGVVLVACSRVKPGPEAEPETPPLDTATSDTGTDPGTTPGPTGCPDAVFDVSLFDEACFQP